MKTAAKQQWAMHRRNEEKGKRNIDRQANAIHSPRSDAMVNFIRIYRDLFTIARRAGNQIKKKYYNQMRMTKWSSCVEMDREMQKTN